jgi:1L-myo-inositol 1-phosphate cytidylyltransferase
MDALILAAGLGSRIRDIEPCKPLTELHGLSLLEISIRQLASVGVTQVVVATGYRAEEIEAALPAIAARAGVPVVSNRVEEYRQPNGHSVLAGAAGLEGDFLLVMADHIFSGAVLKELVRESTADDGAILAIDRRLISPLVDPDDATWVATGEYGKIQRIGKGLDHYDAVDCGAFLASHALPEAIRAAIREGLPGSLSDGIQRLANSDQARAVDIGNAWWIDVDDVHALGLAKAEVCSNLPELFGHGDTADSSLSGHGRAA